MSVKCLKSQEKTLNRQARQEKNKTRKEIYKVFLAILAAWR
jgi:hypothetical protein